LLVHATKWRSSASLFSYKLEPVRRGLQHILCIVVFALALSASSLWPQSSRTLQNRPITIASPVDAFTGCYELTMGRWWPWAFGEDTKFVTPPSLFELLSVHGKEGFEKDGFIIRAIPASSAGSAGRKRASFWEIKPSGEINLIWTDGFTGVTLQVERHGNELRGWAAPHFDAPTLVPRRAHVIARKIPCKAPE
jgi:hypothetical protein